MNLGTEPIKLPTIKEQVYEIIKENIISGKLKPGEWLQESKLVDSLNVSRSPVREALKQLVGEGLLENIPNKGVFVKTLSIKDIYNIFEFREVMEKYAIKKSIDVFTEDYIEALDEISLNLKEAFEKGDLNEYTKIDTKLHYFLFEMCDNEMINDVVNNVFPLLQSFRIISLNSKSRFEESLEEHNGLIEGIKERNFDKAWGYNKVHLRLARDEIIKHLQSFEK
ncbi:MAG: GntR family transcriptional regulator [Tissierellaceae bacterium]|nr:GntR family transcriptional regulator [Tissierellaceae bacterium]